MHFATLAALSTLAGMCSSHMILAMPAPFTTIVTELNGPMNGTGESTYPCKYLPSKFSKDAWYTVGTRTKLNIGQPSQLRFTGSAVHGGGSCQLSLTRDLQPTRNSVFKVIHSIEGGCPNRKTAVNLDGTKDTPDPEQYSFTVPAGIEPGQYTFAWTWFNHVGNREMYMNCAPVEVTGGGAKEKRDSSFFDSLPDIFLANIPDVDCKSSSGGSSTIAFPNPGKSVEKNPIMAEPRQYITPLGKDLSKCVAPPVGSSGSSSQQSGSSAQGSSSGSSSGSGPGSGSPGGPSASIATSSLAISPSYTPPSQPIMNQIAPFSQSNSSSGASASASASAPSASSGASSGSDSSNSGSSSSGSTGSGSCPSTAVSCSKPGSVVCVGSSQFGLCDINNCAIIQALASGTTCSNGVISKRDTMVVAAGAHRRHVTHPHSGSHRYVPRL